MLSNKKDFQLFSKEESVKKKEVYCHPEGSAERVIAHARYQRSRRRWPSMPFITERNPRRALVLAEAVIKGSHCAESLSWLGGIAMEARPYHQMGEAEIEAAVHHIISTSSSEAEVRRRIRDELGHREAIELISHIPEDKAGLEARELVRGLGGPIMQNGAMVMVMMYGPDGMPITV